MTLAGQTSCTGDAELNVNIEFVRTLPVTVPNAAPADVPEKIGNAYVDGMDILALGKWTPAAGSFRTSLDRATQVLWADLGTTEALPFKLDVRLKKLATNLSIPKAMMDWADTVRVVGNEMHDLDDVSKEDAEDAAHFVETFLTYMFTLPKRVERFKARRGAE